MDGLVNYYRRISGEHPDWDDYRRAMEHQQQCWFASRSTRWVPPAPASLFLCWGLPTFPITDSEAGLYSDEQGAWLLTADEEPDQPEDPLTDPEVADQHRMRMLLDPVSEALAAPDRHTWRGEAIDGPGGPLYWHPDLGYVSVPNPEDEP
jgi:hypothetical protein